MRRTFIVIGLALGLGAIWIGRIAWRKHHDLVTLHVRSAPLVEVIRELERQTNEKLRLDPKLDAKVTLDVKNMPLTNVLDLISDQAGARWRKTFAVYDNATELRRLERALSGESALDEVGWTNLAPRLSEADFPGMDSFAAGGGPVKIIRASPNGGGPGSGPMVVNDEDVRKFIPENLQDRVTITHGNDGGGRTITATTGEPGSRRVINISTNGAKLEKDGPDAGPAGRPMKSLVVRRTAGPGGITTTMSDGEGRIRTVRTSADGTVIKEDQWSSARLVMDSMLASRLDATVPTKATAETAAQTARKVRGQYVTYYELEKPPIAGGAGMSRLARSMSQRELKDSGTNNPIMNGDIRERVAAEARQRRLEELSKSPEQQVQRARQRQEAQSEK